MQHDDRPYRSSISFRMGPPPERWREILLTVGVLYGVLIGVPVLAGIWAAWRIWLQVH